MRGYTRERTVARRDRNAPVTVRCGRGTVTQPSGLTATDTADGVRLEWDRPGSAVTADRNVFAYDIFRDGVHWTTIRQHVNTDFTGGGRPEPGQLLCARSR